MLVKIWKALKYLVLGTIFFVIGLFLLHTLTVSPGYLQDIVNLPNYNYVHDIKKLKEEGKYKEALDLADYVLRNPDLPGQEEAKVLRDELDAEINSWWGKAKRFLKGFAWGEANSIEEVAGGITSDMIIWGDIRDLIKQGYYKITGNDTDPLIVALAGIGLATELVDFADWAPAVLKGLRKVGAFSAKFVNFIIDTAKRSAKLGKLDDGLKLVFKSIGSLTDKIGLARTASVMKHVDDVDELATITRLAEKNADTAYLVVKNGGKDGISMIKQFGNAEDGIKVLSTAAKKGPAGIQFLKSGGAGRKYVIGTRIVARVIKNLRLERFQNVIKYAIQNYPYLKLMVWAVSIFSLVFSAVSLLLFFITFRELIISKIINTPQKPSSA